MGCRRCRMADPSKRSLRFPLSKKQGSRLLQLPAVGVRGLRDRLRLLNTSQCSNETVHLAVCACPGSHRVHPRGDHAGAESEEAERTGE